MASFNRIRTFQTIRGSPNFVNRLTVSAGCGMKRKEEGFAQWEYRKIIYHALPIRRERTARRLSSLLASAAWIGPDKAGSRSLKQNRRRLIREISDGLEKNLQDK